MDVVGTNFRIRFALFNALGGSEVLGPPGNALSQVKSASAANEEQLAELSVERDRADADDRAAIDRRVRRRQEDQQ